MEKRKGAFENLPRRLDWVFLFYEMKKKKKKLKTPNNTPSLLLMVMVCLATDTPAEWCATLRKAPGIAPRYLLIFYICKFFINLLNYYYYYY